MIFNLYLVLSITRHQICKYFPIIIFLDYVQERCGLRCEDSDPGWTGHYFKILMELWNILMELRANCGY